MSVAEKIKPITVKTLLKKKKNGQKITMLTSYDYSTAKYVDEAGVDTILVGDSVGMTTLGYETTLNVTMDDMKIFTGAVSRGAKTALVIADMPFMSYHVSKEEAVKNAGELIRAGAQAVKLEGASDYILDIVKHMTDCGIAVVGHIGFTPQYINSLGGYIVQGKSYENSVRLAEEAIKLQKAGVFAVVLEMVPEETATYITKELQIPTIGIGAGRFTDGQVLVIDDLIGKYSDFTPKFVKKYADIKSIIIDSAKSYVKDINENKFPNQEHVFNLKPEEKSKVDNYFNK
ncbi:MAG: 3-methyl-2-oxobutanoate hydroxymethyltransferase [Candidatus Gastranaerophilales bacterium]|nr:3-methyl-2-oxobutanoate hydroxymethyltransferase [Candidatus Gastranaerophilales bacterium]